MERRKSVQNQKGAAMIFVMCVLCIFSALALSMIFMAFQVLSTAQKSGTREQAKISAVTYSKQLESEITDSSGVGDVTSKSATEIQNVREFLRKYVGDESDSSKWKYYDTVKPGHGKKQTGVVQTLTTDIPGSENTLGTIKTAMYWQKETNAANDISLTTEVTATFRNESYKTKTKYYLRVDETAWYWYTTSTD